MRRQGAMNREPAQGTSIAAFLALVRTGPPARRSRFACRSGRRASETEIGNAHGATDGATGATDSSRFQPTSISQKPLETAPHVVQPNRLTGSPAFAVK